MIDPVKLKKCRKQVDRNLKQFCERVGSKYSTWVSWEAGTRPADEIKALHYLNSYTIEGFKVERIQSLRFTKEDISSET